MPVSHRFRPLSHAWIDDSRAPIYTLTYPASPSDDEVVARNEEIYTWYRALDHRIAWVVDCTKLLQAGARTRHLQAQHVARIEPYAARWDVCDAFVIDSSLVRGYLTAVFWFAPPPYEYQLFPTVPLAFDWVYQKFAADSSGSAERHGTR